MVTAFHHGVKTRYVDTVPRPVRVVPSATILLVGTAPTYKVDSALRTVNEPVQCLSNIDDILNFGAASEGWSIPAALNALRDHGAFYVDVVNVWNPDTDNTDAAAVPYSFTSTNVIQLKQVDGVGDATTVNAEGLTGTFTVTGSGGSPSYTLDDDYTYNATTGQLTRVTTGSIPANGAVEVTYTYADPGLVEAADIVGTVTAGGDRTGLQLAEDIYGLRGYKPKILIAPTFSELATVAAELEAMATKIEAVTFVDAPVGTTRAEAISGRNGTGPAANFATNSDRVILCYPHVKVSETELEPLSQRAAGVMAQTDANNGYWWSPSNKTIQGIIGAEIRLTADILRSDTEVNALNEVGITTILQELGTGQLLWGNRTAAYPTDTTPLTFIPVRRALDIFHESLARASRPFIDRPINDALITAIAQTANNFVREQAQLGALIPGSRVFYDPTNNPASTLAAGRITFNCSIMIPTPAETIIYETTLDITLLNGLGQSVAA
jgi:phage tail sheath protein FI